MNSKVWPLWMGLLGMALLACRRQPPVNPGQPLSPFSTPTWTPPLVPFSPGSSPSQSPTFSQTSTPSPTATESASLTASASFTETFTPSATLTESATLTDSLTITETRTRTPSRTATFTASPTRTPAPVSFSGHVQPIFSANCASCHGSNGGLTLSSGTSYLELADVPAESSCVGQPRVDKAGMDPDASVLVFKISGFSCGSKMGHLSAGQIQVIRDWISQGALNN